MSFQVQPQAQPQQPVQVYPISVSNQPPNSHHSNGSFGTVFIVLAVILVISLLACFLGRLCSRRSRPEGSQHGGHGPKPFKQLQNMNQSQNHHFRPKEGDVELGFDKIIPTTKPNGPSLGHGPGPGPGYGGRGPRPLYGAGGGNGGASSGEEKGFEMKTVGEGSMREQGHGHGPRPGLGYGGRGPRPLVYGGGRGSRDGGGGEEKGFEMKNGEERSRREQGYGHEHDAPYKFTL